MWDNSLILDITLFFLRKMVHRSKSKKLIFVIDSFFPSVRIILLELYLEHLKTFGTNSDYYFLILVAQCLICVPQFIVLSCIPYKLYCFSLLYSADKLIVTTHFNCFLLFLKLFLKALSELTWVQVKIEWVM